jgi:hypothetical protein
MLVSYTTAILALASVASAWMPGAEKDLALFRNVTEQVTNTTYNAGQGRTKIVTSRKWLPVAGTASAKIRGVNLGSQFVMVSIT